MSNDQNNSNGQNNGGGISPMEMEKLNPSGDSDNNANINNNNNTTTAPVRSGVSSFLPDHPCDRLMLLIKLYFELYPRLMWGGCLVLFVLVIKWWSPWTSWYNAKYYQRNYMTRDYSNLQNDFNFKAAKIDHWCLFGGDDKCYCEDPMEGMPRSEILGWNDAHNRNKELVDLTVARTGGNIDVLFIGEQTVQSWNGVWLSKTAPEGPRIARYFNDTFNSPKAAFQGLALGIYGDRLNNILWRIQHGEMPPTLDPKVFWLLMGTNDLALGLCSEEVVTLGIMRIAEEIHHHYPNSVVVIQGILPRSNHKDGSLEGSTKYSNGAPGGQKKWFKKTDGSGSGYQRLPLLPPRQRQLHLEAMVESEMERELQYATPTSSSTDTTTSAASSTGGAATRSPTTGGGSQTLGQQAMSSSSSSAGTSGFTRTSSSSASNYANWKQQNHYNEDRSPQPGFDYYLWPSIKRINKELEDFCAKHEHLVYFDSDELLLGSIGNERYRAAHKSIIRDLMPNYVHLNSVGHKVVIDAINDELQRIIYDDDEKNDIETQKGSVRKSKTGGS